MCLPLLPSFSACSHPASCSRAASGFSVFICFVPLSQSDTLVGEMATSKGPTGLCVSRRAERRPIAHGRTSVHSLWRMMACPWVGENSEPWSKSRVPFDQSLKKGTQ